MWAAPVEGCQYYLQGLRGCSVRSIVSANRMQCWLSAGTYLAMTTFDVTQVTGARTTSQLFIGNAEDLASSVVASSVAAIATSPPYWARRRYTLDPLETGQGDLDTYIDDLSRLFTSLRSALADDGVLWINIGDTAAGSGGSGGDYGADGARAGQLPYRQGRSGLAKGQWASVPHRLAHRLVDDGWLLRSTVIWDKGQRRREPLGHCRRPGESHEYVFMFTKKVGCGFDPSLMTEDGSVWHVKPATSRNGHVAPMPLELATRMLEAVTAEGSVLDPFAGSGTTLEAAARLCRSSIGFELDAANAERFRKRMPATTVITVVT